MSDEKEEGDTAWIPRWKIKASREEMMSYP